MRHARARLWLAEGDFERAHAEAVKAGALRAEQGRPNPSLDAVALDRGAAPSPTSGAATRRRRWPTPSLRWRSASVRQCRSPARCTPAPSPSPTPLRASRSASARCAVVAGAPRSLESVRLRLELGSALAYLGRRVEARDALRPALADADAAGAVLLAQRARRELVATGLRPRHAAWKAPRR